MYYHTLFVRKFLFKGAYYGVQSQLKAGTIPGIDLKVRGQIKRKIPLQSVTLLWR
jgi:hypothetical protein